MESCSTFDWNPIASSAAYSALAAVLAGFVFTGIVVIITERARPARRIRTMRLFLSALLIFGFSSYLEALTAGEATCLRAWSVAAIAGGLLGLGAVNIFAGIAWLLDTYLADDDLGQRLKNFVISLVVGTALAVALLLSDTVTGYWNDSYGTALPRWVNDAVLGYSFVGMVVLLLLGARWRLRRAPLATLEELSTTQGDDLGTIDRALRLSTTAVLVYTVVCVVATGFVINIPREDWNPIPNQWLPIAVGLAAMVAPTLILMAQVLGLPPRHPTATLAKSIAADTEPPGDGELIA